MTVSIKENKLKTQLGMPLIILGMHRSGTSLTTRLMADCGVFPGDRLSINAESVYFRKFNEKVYRAAGSSWSDIQRVCEKMDDAGFVSEHADILNRMLFHGHGIQRFFSNELWSQLQKGESVDWGWKDPRTTITLPVWLKVFPDARFLTVRRNGIDVAISLHRRALKNNQFWKRFSPMHYFSQRMFKLSECLELWAEHLRFEEKHLELIPGERLKCIEYENLLRDPFNILSDVLRFARVDFSQETLQRVCSQINTDRLDNSRFVQQFQGEIKPLLDHPMLVKYGYDTITRSYFSD